MAFATASDGVQLYYEVHGTGSTTLVLLHGMGDREVWQWVRPQFDLHALRVVTFDFRGHGRSGGHAGPFTYKQFNADVAAVADAVGAVNAMLGGFSGGAKNSVCFAAEHPGRVRGLVLVAPPGMATVPIPREIFRSFSEYVESHRDVPQEFADWFTEKAGAGRAAFVHSLVATPRAVLDASAELWLYTPVTARAGRVQHPVLVVAGARDAMYSPDFQRDATLRVFPRAEMVVLPCGHFIPLEEPARLAQAIERFCQSPLPA